MEIVSVCEQCGRELRLVDGQQVSGCSHYPADFPALLKSLPENFMLIRVEQPCPKCKATMGFNHVVTDEVVARSVHCGSCGAYHCLLVGPVKGDSDGGTSP